MKFITLLALILMVGCNPSKKKENTIISNDGTTTGGSTGGSESGTATSYGIIFVSEVSLSGSGSGNGGSGFQEFDDACADSAQSKGLTGTFKALITSNTRRACSTANCGGGASERLDWPLGTRVEYRREDKTTVIGKTNSKGIFNLPLTNAFSSTSTNIWTGLNTDWTTAVNCLNWTDDSLEFGRRSNANDTGLAGNGFSCSNNYKFLCAEVKADVAATAQPSYRKIFATTNTYSPYIFMGDGVTRLDGFCESEKTSKGFTEDDRFKALVMGNGGGTSTKRIACLTAYCGAGTSEQVNWVLDSNRQYRREDGSTIIGTTNANAIFDYPLTNSLTGSADEFWTGFPDTWAILNVGSNQDCASWTTNDSSYNSYYGVGNTTTLSAFSSSFATCNINRKILCVEQTR